MTDRQERYDYVIVGGGSAGCALANRLSADPSTTVLVLEAGRRDWRFDVFIHMPAALSFPIGSRFYDWKYTSEPEPHMGGRRIYHARGKVLGGSSSINGMIFQRGNPLDFERWAAGRGHAALGLRPLPALFQTHGELPGRRRPHRSVRRGRVPGRRRSARAGTGTGRQPAVPGVSGSHRAGRPPLAPATSTATARRASPPSTGNVHRGRRLSAARAYLHPVLNRQNLNLVTRAFTTKIVFDGNRAVGVAYTKGGRSHIAEAGEVICCGGAINSPQLLQLSGVGPADLLARHGIDVVADVPAVGANMQDHLEVYVQYACKQPVSMQPHLAMWRRPWIGLQWLARGGPGATNHFEAGGLHPQQRRRGLPQT